MPRAKKTPSPGPDVRLTGERREQFAVQVAEQYNSGMTIREIATFHDRSFGNIQRMLVESGVTRRPRGGSRKAS